MRVLACVSGLVVVVVCAGVKADYEVSKAGCDSIVVMYTPALIVKLLTTTRPFHKVPHSLVAGASRFSTALFTSQ